MRLPRIPLGGGSRPGHRYLAGAPLLIAHRGGAALAPENTLPALERALRWWRADLLEIDVQPTADGDCVVIHDPTLERTTDGRGPVAARTLAELREMDAGFRFTPDGGASFPFRGTGVRLSTFREVLEAFPGARVNVEIKDARAAPPVLEAITALGAEHRVLVAAGDTRNRALFRGHPGPVGAGAQELYAFHALHLARATRFYRPPVDAFQVPETSPGGRRVLDPRWIAEAHAHGVAVHVWTVNAEADMRRLLGWGVDGIVTDRPDRLARVLHERGGRPLPPGPPAGESPPWLECLLLA
jgi:glycerophosphoryl diester phosphodiesterase